MKIISSDRMPVANGHYSQCIEHNGFLFISGQLPIDQLTRKIPVSIEKQTELTLSNVKKVLNEAGSSIEKIIQMRVYISDVQLWDKVNKVYADFFGDHKPVRCIVPTRDLHFGCLVEIETTAIA